MGDFGKFVFTLIMSMLLILFAVDVAYPMMQEYMKHQKIMNKIDEIRTVKEIQQGIDLKILLEETDSLVKEIENN